MLIVTYDIENDKARTKFSKFLKKFGFRLQYSVYQIKNSDRILNIIKSEIEHNFSGNFKETDSVIIFHLSKQCKKISYGYAKNDDEELLLLF